MDSRKSLTMVLAAFLIALFLPAVAMAVPSVSVECAYTNPGATDNAPDLECEVYLINPDEVGFISAGVALHYNTDALVTPTVTKNTTDWYLGTDPPGATYMAPEVTETAPDGLVVYILGRYDSDADPDTGVTATRVLLGTAKFARKTNDILTGNQQAYFGISAALGRTTPASFVNFVNTAGGSLDVDVDFSGAPKVVQRGDANADGIIDIGDPREIGMNISTPNLPVYYDCNADGIVDIGDVRCAAGKI